MDSVTQGLLGAVIGQLGFRRRIGKEASWVAAGAAIVPDLDLFLMPFTSLSGAEHGEFEMLVTHRGLSHSLFLIPLYSIPIAAVWWWIKRKRRGALGSISSEGGLFGPIYFCVLAAMLSGPLLDLFTAYGTQILLPFSERRFAVDAVPIVDIIYTPILLITLIVCGILRRTGKGGERRSLKAAIVGFVISCCYIAAGAAVRGVVVESARGYFGERGVSAGAGSVSYEAYPQIPTIFVWRVTREDARTWTAGRVNVLFGLDLAKCEWNRAERVDNEWVEKARELADVKIFEWFAMGQTRATYTRRDGLHIVTFGDMRYGVRPASLESLWGARVVFDEGGKVVAVEQVRHYGGGGFGEMVKRLWGDLFRR